MANEYVISKELYIVVGYVWRRFDQREELGSVRVRY